MILPSVRIIEPSDLLEFDISPNPAIATLTLSISENDLLRVDSYEVIDQRGQCVYYSKSLDQRTIHVAKLLPGMYNLVLKGDEKVKGVRRFVKMQ